MLEAAVVFNEFLNYKEESKSIFEIFQLRQEKKNNSFGFAMVLILNISTWKGIEYLVKIYWFWYDTFCCFNLKM